jgi:Ser/Thr protein kinase RdoA (MazF antagonist)
VCDAANVLSDHAAVLANSFGRGAAVQNMGLAARGEQGRVWRLDTDQGTFAIKELFIRQTEVDAAADAAYQEAVLATETVPMPRPIRTAAGDILSEVDEHQVRAYEWVELLPTDLTLDPAIIGVTLAAVHRIQHRPARPLLSWYTEPVGAPRWAQLLNQAADIGAPFTRVFDAEIPTLLRLEALMEPPTQLQNCHRDLWADNMLPTRAGGICVIDWENCGLEDPAQELPMALFDFAGRNMSRAARLYESYLDAGGPARITGYGSYTMLIAQFGHFWESAVERYLAPEASDQEKAHSLGRIEELLVEPLRIDHIDQLIETIVAAPIRPHRGQGEGM